MTMRSGSSQGRGCLFYGITAALLLLVLVVVGLFLSYRFVKHSVNGMIAAYTQTNAAPIPVVALPPERLREVQTRLQEFQETLARGGDQTELVLTAEEINGLIEGDPSIQHLRDHLFVRVEEGQIRGDVSIPLRDVGPIKLEGRHLNGQAAFQVVLTNGYLWISMTQVTVNGKTLPSVLQKELVKQNLASDIPRDEAFQEFMEKMESIEVRDDSIVLRAKEVTDAP